MFRRKMIIVAAVAAVLLLSGLLLALGSRHQGLAEPDLDRYILPGATALKRVSTGQGAAVVFQATNHFHQAAPWLSERFNIGHGSMSLTALDVPAWLPIVKPHASCIIQNGWKGGPQSQLIVQNRRNGLIWAYISALDTNSPVRLVLGFHNYAEGAESSPPFARGTTPAGGASAGFARVDPVTYTNAARRGAVSSSSLTGLKLNTADAFGTVAGYLGAQSLPGEPEIVNVWREDDYRDRLFLWTSPTNFYLAKAATAEGQTNTLMQAVAAMPH